MDNTTDFSGTKTPPSDMTFEALLEQVQNLEEQVAMQSIDRLTSVLSSDQFFSEVQRILKEFPTETFVMWRFDIDKFQTVNHLFGVEEGNRLLIYCSKYLKQSIPSSRSSAIGRMGGDIFCGITPYSPNTMTSGEQGNHWLTASSTLSNMERFFKGFRDDFRFSVSIGFYQIEDHNDPIEILYSRVLAASKSCKEHSEKIYAFYDHALSAAIEETQIITAEMHAALENGEFTVFLQPKVRLSDLSLVGAEALVRWFHPKKGKIQPDSFIPIFEENGFITKLDLYVLRRCCAYIQSWMRQGINLIPLSVNLSQMDLATPGLPFKIMAILDEYHVSAKYIHLEITESAYADDVEQVGGVTQAFKDLGFHLEMDDFGKGYSSLNMIAELPIDTLKMDMGFLQGDYTQGGGKVISFVTGLARHMELVTVAEGIETQEQLAFLRSINCDCGQGYLFSRPLAKSEFDAYMRACTISPMGAHKVKNVEQSVSAYKGWNTEEIWDVDSKFSKMFNALPRGVGVCELDLLKRTFRLGRYNDQFVTALHTSRDILKQHCENLLELVHEEDILPIQEAMTAIYDPKDWSKETGIVTKDLRIKILTEEETETSSFTWVRLTWNLVDFSTDTRTYILQADDVNQYHNTLENMKQRLAKVDTLERQMNIYSNAGLVGIATLFFDYYNQEKGGEVIDANPQFFALHSKVYTPEQDQFPLTMDHFLQEDSVTLFHEGFTKEFALESDAFEWRLPLTDIEGTTRNTVTTGKISYKEQGIYVDIVVGIISEISTLQGKLSATEERYQSLLSSTEVSKINYRTGQVHWAHNMQVAFGLPSVETMDASLPFPGSHVFNPESLIRMELLLWELKVKEGSQTIECWMRQENYVDYALYRLSVYSNVDEKGQVTSISMVGRDITLEHYAKSNVTLAEIAIHMPDGLFVFAVDTGKLLFANNQFYQITGLTKEKMEDDFQNYPLLLIHDEEYRPHAVLPELVEGEGHGFTRIAQLKNHSMRWITIHGIQKGKYVYATVQDFTERKSLEIQLEREMGFNEILNHIADELLFRVNIPEKTVLFNGKSAENFGLSQEPIHFSSHSMFQNIIAEEHEPLFFEMLEDMVAGVEKTYELQMIDKNQQISWYRFEYRIIHEVGEPAFTIGKAVNIDLEVGLMAKLERDPLTACYNASAMKLHANQILSNSFPANEVLDKESESNHALLVIEIKNYARVSANVSHQVRDEMILQLAEIINHKFRETDFVGKIAEDQFVVFMKNVSVPTRPLQKVSDLYMDFKHNNTMAKPQLKLDIDIRCAFAFQDGQNFSSLLENAKLIPIDVEIY